MKSKKGKHQKMNPASHLRTYNVAELERIAHEQLRKLGIHITFDFPFFIYRCRLEYQLVPGFP